MKNKIRCISTTNLQSLIFFGHFIKIKANKAGQMIISIKCKIFHLIKREGILCNNGGIKQGFSPVFLQVIVLCSCPKRLRNLLFCINYGISDLLCN